MKRGVAVVPTRERILDEVEELIVSKGVYGFKLRDVAERLGLRVPAIYKHYASRDDVLIEVARRSLAWLALQFDAPITPAAAPALRAGLDRLVEGALRHPAYVRLALADASTPSGAVAYVTRAAGRMGRRSAGPRALSAMQERLRRQLLVGARRGEWRRVDAADFHRVISAALLARLVFPDDRLLRGRSTPAEVRAVQRWLWNIARVLLAGPDPARRPS
jgi:AcrR family transcriptional regulator